jgi:myo-inositol 2-dehydrogenase / D-chiro-inositol 1-dehydrogenase
LDKIGIALIGCGEIAQLHAQALEQTGRARIVATLDRDLDKAQFIAAKHGATVFNDLDEVLANPQVGAVFVLTRHDSHPDIILRSLAAGKHVFSEKPLALSVDEALRIVDAVQNSGCFLMLGFNHRWNPAVQWLHNKMREIQSPVLCVHITFATSPFLQSWAGLDGEGGGVLHCLGSHALDLACFLLKDQPAQLATFTSRQRLSDPYLPDTAGIILSTRSGAIASILFHDHAAPSYPNYAKPGPGRLVRAEVFSEGFSATIEDSHNIRIFTNHVSNIQLADNGPLVTLGIFPEVEHFISCLSNGIRPEPDERDGLRAVQLVSAAAISAKRGGTIEFRNETE